MKPPQAHFLPPSLPSSLVPNTSLSLSVSLSLSLSSLLSRFSKLSSSSHNISLSCPLQPTPTLSFFAPSHFSSTIPPVFLTSQSFDLLLSFTLLIIVWVCCRHLVLMSFCLNQVYFLCSLRPQTDVSPLSKCCSVLMNAAGSGDVHSVRLYLLQGFWIVINIFTDTFFYFFSPDNHRRM